MNWTTRTSGEFPLQASIRLIGQDLLIAVWGGTHPHIGAVGIAHPRPSLKDTGEISATASIYTVIGHKEDSVVQMMSSRIASALNRLVVLTAGIHWDNLNQKDIKKILESCETLTQTIIDEARAKGL